MLWLPSRSPLWTATLIPQTLGVLAKGSCLSQGHISVGPACIQWCVTAWEQGLASLLWLKTTSKDQLSFPVPWGLAKGSVTTSQQFIFSFRPPSASFTISEILILRSLPQKPPANSSVSEFVSQGTRRTATLLSSFPCSSFNWHYSKTICFLHSFVHLTIIL